MKERRQRGQEGAEAGRLVGFLVEGVGDEGPCRHRDEADRDGIAKPFAVEQIRRLLAHQRGEEVVGERGEQNAEHDRPRPPEACGEHDREQLGLVADLGERDDRGRSQQGFHYRLSGSPQAGAPVACSFAIQCASDQCAVRSGAIVADAVFLPMKFDFDRWIIIVVCFAALAFAGLHWLRAHPQYDPTAPLGLDDRPGWATARKLVGLRADPQECRAFLKRSAIGFTDLPATGSAECRREDRIVLDPERDIGLVLRPAGAQATCAVDAGLALWLRRGVQPAAERLLSSRVVALSHYGTNNCRRIGGGGAGNWSEHATGNAIDVAGFVLADGRTVSIQRDWRGNDARARFLRAVRDAACGTFGTVLSPDYNAAHADHLHLDQRATAEAGATAAERA